MEFPHGRHHHHHQGGDDEERRPTEYGHGEEGYGRPPPPRQEYGYGEEGYGRPPPPRQEYAYGEEGYGRPPPPPPRQEFGYGEEGYGRPPPPPPRQEFGYGGEGYVRPPPPRQEYGHGEEGYGHPPPPRPEYGYGEEGYPPVQHVSHHVGPHGSGGNDAMEALMRQPTFKIYCKANDGVCLAIRDGTVLLATTDESDLSQHWIKDLRYSTRVKDEEGYPAFSLINKSTGQALKHSVGKGHPVQLMEYNPEKLEESVLWTESRDVGDNFRCIRMVNNIYLNFNAWHGDKDHGGVHDGTTLALYEWCKGDNERWKIVPWYIWN